MPKVSDASFRIDGKMVKFDVYYSKQNQFYIKGLPGDVLQLGGESVRLKDGIVSGYLTEAALNASLAKIIEQYHARKRRSRKMILYQIAATAVITMNKVGEGCFSGHKDGLSKKVKSLQADGWGFVIDYVLALEIEDNGLSYKYIDEEGKVGHNIPCAGIMQKIEWSEQRELVFRQICGGMGDLVAKLSSVICDEQRLAEVLDSGSKGGFLGIYTEH